MLPCQCLQHGVNHTFKVNKMNALQQDVLVPSTITGTIFTGIRLKWYMAYQNFHLCLHCLSRMTQLMPGKGSGSVYLHLALGPV